MHLKEKFQKMEQGIIDRFVPGEQYDYNQVMFAASEYVYGGVTSDQVDELLLVLIKRGVIMPVSRKGGKSSLRQMLHDDCMFVVNPFGELLEKAKSYNA
jgi:hypothetical protein